MESHSIWGISLVKPVAETAAFWSKQNENNSICFDIFEASIIPNVNSDMEETHVKIKHLI